jgi:baculoviral IAP repeat-containing protein 6
VKDFLDLSQSKTYIITICSSKLYEARSNLFYLNLTKVKQTQHQHNINQINQYVQKVEITIRKYRKHGLENETLERIHMLNNREYFSKVLFSILDSTSQQPNLNDLSRAIDILSWIIYNHLTSIAKSNEYLDLFSKYLKKFLSLLLNSNRTISKKLVIILNMLLRIDYYDNKFATNLFNMLLSLLESDSLVEQFQSSTSMYYFFYLLNQLINYENDSKSYEKLLSKLNNLLPLYFEKIEQNHLYYSLLKIKSLTSSSTILTSSNMNSIHTIFEKDLFNVDDVYLRSVMSSSSYIHQSIGLLETLPSNYKLISSSPATSLEKASLFFGSSGLSGFSNTNNSNNNKNESGNYFYLPSTLITDINSSKNPQEITNNTFARIDTSLFNTIFNLNQMQNLNVERMEPVSRHFAILDFGLPIYITDILIPSCSEIASLSIDYWLNKEQKDSKRLILSTTITHHPIQLVDLQPPPLARYVKLIFVSHSSNVVKARIPLGYYFGQPQQLDSTYYSYLKKLYEENKSHFIQTIGKLKEYLLYEIQYPNDNIGHLKMANLVLTNSSSSANACDLLSGGDSKLKELLNESIEYQSQLNLNMNLLNKLSSSNSELQQQPLIPTNRVTQDKIKLLNQYILKTLICLNSNNNSNTEAANSFDIEQAFNLFKYLCVYGNLEKECSTFLVKYYSKESWWGDFIAKCLKYYFVNNQIKEPLILSKIFLNLNEMCIKSLKLNSQNAQSSEQLNTGLFRSLFQLIIILLKSDEGLNCEISSLEWLVLFITRLLNLLNVNQASKQSGSSSANRWEFLEKLNTSSSINPFNANIKSKFLIGNSSSSQIGTIININPLNKNKFKKKLLQSSSNLSSAALNSGGLNSKHKFGSKRKLLEDQQLQNSKQNQQQQYLQAKKFLLPRDVSLEMGKSLVKLLINSNSYSSSDLFVLTCRILSSICLNTQPCIGLNELFDNNEQNLLGLINLNVSLDFNHGSVCWGSPWAQHALLCLLVDVVENEKMILNSSKTSNTEAQPFTSSSTNSNTLLTDLDLNNILIEEDEDVVSTTTTHHANFASSSSSNVLFKESDLKANLISNLVESAMSKKFDEIKSNIVAPFQQMSQLFSSSSQSQSSNSKKLIQPNLIPFQKTHSSNLASNIANNNNNNNSNDNKYSLAYDMRLDTSVYQTLENDLFIRLAQHNESINSAFEQLNNMNLIESYSTPSSCSIPSESQSSLGSINLIQNTLETLFQDLKNVNLENLLTFWLTLTNNDDLTTDINSQTFHLKEDTFNYLLEILCNFPFITIKLWFLSFKTLIQFFYNINSTNNPLVFKLILKYLYANNYEQQQEEKILIGDECNQMFIDLLNKLVVVDEDDLLLPNMSINQRLVRTNLFSILNKILEDKLQHYHNRAVDAQIAFVEFLLGLSNDSYFNQSINNEMFESLMTNLSKLIKKHLYIYPRCTFKGHLSPRSCFSSVLTSLLFGTPNSNSNSNINNNNSSSGSSSATSSSGSTTSTTLNNKFVKSSPSTSSSIFESLQANHQNNIHQASSKQIEKIKNQSVLCTQDLFMCLLLKLSINVINNNATNVGSSLNKTRKSNIILEEELIDEDDANEEGNDENDEDDIPELALVENLKTECLEMFIESLALCQSSALAMVISNSGYPIELTSDDVKTTGDGLYLLMKTLGAKSPLKLLDSCYAYLCKIKRLSEPLLWFFSSIFAQQKFIKEFVHSKNGLDIVCKGLSLTTRQLLYSGPCIISSVMNLLDTDRSLLGNSNASKCISQLTNMLNFKGNIFFYIFNFFIVPSIWNIFILK